MKPIKTLLLYSRGAPRVDQIFLDSLLRGVLKIPYETPPPKVLASMGVFGGKVAGRIRDPYAALGYVNDWREAFKANAELDVIECNITDLFSYRKIRALLGEVPLTVILHSAAGDDMGLLLATANWFQNRSGKLAVFLGNEYDLIEEKKSFLSRAGADYLCTQLPIQAAQFVYGDSSSYQLIEMPHALNQYIFKPQYKRADRKIHFGFIGAKYPDWIGDTERNDFLVHCKTELPDYDNLIQFGVSNVAREQWAMFLNKCQGTIGAEAGTYYLDKLGNIVSRAKLASLGKLDLAETISDRDGSIPFVSGKAISSRHFEAIGTKTVQLLLEGDYNGILKPGLHYLAVKKDLSNLREKLDEFDDLLRQEELANLSYEYAMDCHTYDIRVSEFISAVLG